MGALVGALVGAFVRAFVGAFVGSLCGSLCREPLWGAFVGSLCGEPLWGAFVRYDVHWSGQTHSTPESSCSQRGISTAFAAARSRFASASVGSKQYKPSRMHDDSISSQILAGLGLRLAGLTGLGLGLGLMLAGLAGLG